MLLDRLAVKLGARFRKSFRLGGFIARAKLKNNTILLVKPATFMNNSGNCIRKVINSYKVGCERCLVVYDDVDLSLGAVRLKDKGGSAGHRGLESIIESIDSNQINRLRLGIGRPQDGGEVSDYVLSNFSSTEGELLEKVITQGVSACIDWVNLGSSFVMSNYNRRGE